MLQIHRHLSTTVAMEQLGAAIAQASTNQVFTLFLSGDLGTGKTTLVRGFLRSLGYTGKVKSPTFTLLEPYELSTSKIFHFDLYRLTSSQELAAIGWHDCFDGNNTCLIEWPERAGTETPPVDLLCELRSIDEVREATLTAISQTGQLILKRFELK